MGTIYKTLAVTIANGEALTAEIDLGSSGRVTGIHMPASWTAADLTLRAAPASGGNSHSPESGTYADVYDDNDTEVVIQAAASRYLALYANVFDGARFIKLRSGTTGTPVNQGAARTLYLDIETNDSK